MAQEKLCEICGKGFRPAPRRWKKQTVCLRKKCRKKAKAMAHRRWLRKTPGYFQGRYPGLKGHWDYAGYLRDYRVEHPEYVVAENRARRKRRKRQKPPAAEGADIQELVHRRQKTIFAIRSRRGAGMQDTIRLQLDGVLDFLGAGRSADIQESVHRR